MVEHEEGRELNRRNKTGLYHPRLLHKTNVKTSSATNSDDEGEQDNYFQDCVLMKR